MFCEKCGKENPNGSKFCEGCGVELPEEKATPVDNVEDFVGNAVNMVKNNENLKKIIPIGIAVVAVLLVIGLLSMCGVFKAGSVKAVEKYFQATVKGDGKALFELEVDPYELETAIEDERYDDKEDAIDTYKDRAEDMKDDLEDEFGDRLRVSLKDVKVSKKYKKDEIKDLAEYLEEEYDYDANALQELVIVKGKATIKGSEDDDSDRFEVVVAKIKGKWYVDGAPGLTSKDSIKSVLDRD